MDTHINQSLEIGLGFMLFVMGLSVFLILSGSVEKYLLAEATYASKTEGVMISKGTVVTSVTTQEIFFRLTEKGNQVGDVYVQGVLLPYPTDEASEATLIGVLKTMGRKRFLRKNTLDEQGKCIKVEFIPIH